MAVLVRLLLRYEKIKIIFQFPFFFIKRYDFRFVEHTFVHCLKKCVF
jgi:hypothetical protein